MNIPSNYTLDETINVLENLNDPLINTLIKKLEEFESELLEEIDGVNREYELMEEQLHFAQELIESIINIVNSDIRKPKLIRDILEEINDSSFENQKKELRNEYNNQATSNSTT